ncbi:Deoxyribose-phosphate aldolase [Psilocybe cubensis]|uniref:Deoxyribose-phosphate aldolase n=1 Tax=Psilocybe cubensis TaxID=181762 RepID=A0ACB8GUL5_PSICU|nr:Deoxyribose-phosphate aldolase [Psilocybe cubensis]KAH9479144.1 Deoxyribose-phosphate aldolase [Psilocybe cubensis]
MAEWTEEEWTSFIQSKVAEVLGQNVSTDDSTPLASLSTPSDPRFPLTIDHTLLKQDATPSQIDSLCDEAIQYGFKRVTERLAAANSKTIACCVVGFPLGAGSADAKAYEAQQAIKDGALEVDTVIPVGLLLSDVTQYREIYNHLKTIITACAPVPVKVIIETGLIPSPELKIAACILSAEAGAAFVKTSTGFASGSGATKEDVRLMYRAVKYKGNVQVKASGGVRSFDACKEMFLAGAERIGTSSGVTLIKDAVVVGDGY